VGEHDGETGDVEAPFTPVNPRSTTGTEALAAADLHSSPNRLAIRNGAFEKQSSQARRMQERVVKVQGKIVLGVGDPVRVGVADVDRGKTDPTSVVVVVVEVIRFGEHDIECKYRLACPSGQLRSLYARTYLVPIQHATADQLGFTLTLKHWRDMPVIGERKAVVGDSAVGGQGMLKCHCKGTCKAGKCACWVNDRLCNSRCHPRSKACLNHCRECV
jgi:hypothetical protein